MKAALSSAVMLTTPTSGALGEGEGVVILVLLLDDGREAPGVSTGMIKAAIFLVALVAALRGGRGLEGSRTASREGDCNACVCVCVCVCVCSIMYTHMPHTLIIKQTNNSYSIQN